MWAFVKNVFENYQAFFYVGLLGFILYLTGTLTETLRGIKKGIRNLFTPLGFFVFIAIIILIYIIYQRLTKI